MMRHGVRPLPRCVFAPTSRHYLQRIEIQMQALDWRWPPSNHSSLENGFKFWPLVMLKVLSSRWATFYSKDLINISTVEVAAPLASIPQILHIVEHIGINVEADKVMSIHTHYIRSGQASQTLFWSDEKPRWLSSLISGGIVPARNLQIEMLLLEDSRPFDRYLALVTMQKRTVRPIRAWRNSACCNSAGSSISAGT